MSDEPTEGRLAEGEETKGRRDEGTYLMLARLGIALAISRTKRINRLP